MRNRKKIKANIPMRIAVVLLCLTLFSFYLVSGMFAKYTYGGTKSDSARVAAFHIKTEGTLTQPVYAEIIPGENQSAALKITNDSETAVEYKVKVTNTTENLPLEFELTGKNDAPVAAGSTDGKGVTTLRAQQIAGNHTDEYTLTIKWSADGDNLQYIRMVDYILIEVEATQID